MALRSLALCAGIGGLDLGVRMARSDHQLVGVVERQAYASAVLVARMAAKDLDQAPIWDDLGTFDARAWRGAVDLVTAGFPCQPVSVAGDRRGADDERWLWPEVWRIARECGARLLFVENVPGLRSLGLAGILADLAASGWAAEWDCVPAASVGAPHRRDRLFLLAAHPDGCPVRIEPERDQRARWSERAPERGDAIACGQGDEGPLAHPDGSRLDIIGRGGELDAGERASRGRDPDGCDGAATADATSARREGRGICGPASERDGYWRRTPPEPTFRRVDDGVTGGLDLDDDWAERLHALGNAVVPQAAAFAFRLLEKRLGAR